MSQVFLSYRHVPRDEELAEGLCAYLQARGLRVFLDKQILVGLDWVAEIDRQLRASNAFVVLLSEDSIRSDMVRKEIKTAYKLRRDGKMAIFPVRVDFSGELPYDLFPSTTVKERESGQSCHRRLPPNVAPQPAGPDNGREETRGGFLRETTRGASPDRGGRLWC